MLSSPPSLLAEAPGSGGALQPFLKRLLAAVAAGDVAAFVLRTEGVAAGEVALRAAAEALCGPVQEAGVAFLIEGRADLAVALGCDGVQVPANRATVRSVRRALGADAIVGALCYAGGAAASGEEAQRHAAMEAGEAEADYVAFPAEDQETLAWWAELMEVPCVAWDAEPGAAEALLETGAEFIALAPSLWDEPDPAATVANVQAIVG